MPPHVVAQLQPAVADRPHQIDAAAGAVVLVARFDVRRARGRAQAAVDAVEKQLVVDRRAGAGRLLRPAIAQLAGACVRNGAARAAARPPGIAIAADLRQHLSGPVAGAACWGVAVDIGCRSQRSGARSRIRRTQTVRGSIYPSDRTSA